MRRLTTLASGLLLASVVAACGGTAEISTDELEPQISDQLAQEVGQTPASVDCEEPLPAEVDASVRCELEAEDGTRFGLTVTTTEVDGTDVRFVAQVDQQPIG